MNASQSSSSRHISTSTVRRRQHLYWENRIGCSDKNAVLNIYQMNVFNTVNTATIYLVPLYVWQKQSSGAEAMYINVHCWQGLCSHLFTVFGTDVPLADHSIYCLLSEHFQTLKEDTQSDLFFSKLKALHLQTWLSSHLFIPMESLPNKSELCATEQCSNHWGCAEFGRWNYLLEPL